MGPMVFHFIGDSVQSAANTYLLSAASHLAR